MHEFGCDGEYVFAWVRMCGNGWTVMGKYVNYVWRDDYRPGGGNNEQPNSGMVNMAYR